MASMAQARWTDRSAVSRTSAEHPTGHKPVLVLHKVRRVLDAFTTGSPQLTAREVQRITGLPATTTLRLLHSLTDEGILQRQGDRYRLGLAMLRWARSATEALDLVEVAAPVLAELRDHTEESACLFVRHGSHHACIAVEQTTHPVIQILRVGQVLPLHAGSAGRVFLAFDDAAADELPAELPAFTERTLTRHDEVRGAVEQTRRDGYAITSEERSIGAASVSAPVFDYTGSLVAVLGIASPVQRFGADAVPSYVRHVLAAAGELSRRLGHDSQPHRRKS
jgi:IclR family acetate operon transcriptional repressor